MMPLAGMSARVSDMQIPDYTTVLPAQTVALQACDGYGSWQVREALRMIVYD
jgi:hypothetical protein